MKTIILLIGMLVCNALVGTNDTLYGKSVVKKDVWINKDNTITNTVHILSDSRVVVLRTFGDPLEFPDESRGLSYTAVLRNAGWRNITSEEQLARQRQKEDRLAFERQKEEERLALQRQREEEQLIYEQKIREKQAARNAEMFGQFAIIGIIISVYFFPTIVACINKKRNSSAILVLNFFLGWSLIGWVVALVWATCKDSTE